MARSVSATACEFHCHTIVLFSFGVGEDGLRLVARAQSIRQGAVNDVAVHEMESQSRRSSLFAVFGQLLQSCGEPAMK